MQKTIIITTISLFSLICLGAFINSNMFGSLVMFLLVGLVPGTTYSLPASTMFLIMCAAIWLIVFRFTAIEIAISHTQLKRLKKSSPKHTPRLPRRRFEQI